MGFLDGVDLRPVDLSASPFTPVGLALGQDDRSPLEVVVAKHSGEPSKVTLRSAWKARQGGRAAPLLFVVLYDGRAALCGPTGDDPPARVDLDVGQVERICRQALEQPNRHAALKALGDSLPAIESRLGGIRNEGFLATHELEYGARQRPDWNEAGTKARRVLGKRGEDLLKGLGFELESLDNVTSILTAGAKKVAVAVLLRRDESPELRTERFSNLSPVSHALTVADRENLPYVVIQQGSKIRVYPVEMGVGVGQRGRAETYVQCDTALLRDDDAAYLWLLCSAYALSDPGGLADLLEASGRFSGELAKRLRDRVYESVVPRLAEGLVAARNLSRPTAEDLAETYQMAMTVLFRLLFVAYGEDKDLLPYKWNGLYQRRSLKTKAQEILEVLEASGEEGPSWGAGRSHWEEITRLFNAVDKGNHDWGVPPYNGGLFSDEAEVSITGALLSELELPDSVMGPALRDLLVVENPEGLGPVDFRSLGVREFGTIYEGLLESELSVAETDLATDEEGLYRPVGEGDHPEVLAGDVYLHNASGARKATGTYFTKSFAVEHLLERALEPALDDHFARLEEKDEESAAKGFFDFRVADIAMGSGHFLVAAIDRIERRFTGYLSNRHLPGVAQELAELRAAALNALDQLADQVEVEDTQLLRRLIARRCIYGVDINPIAVQLSRLAIWIHTFVPGLPLSFLNHNLVVGNSLVGIGRMSEVDDAIRAESGGLGLWAPGVEDLLGAASEHLRRLANIADTTPRDLARARTAHLASREALGPAEAFYDIATACNITGDPLPIDAGRWQNLRDRIAGSPEHQAAGEGIGELKPLHFPISFPEVFLRPRPGFDAIIGNPPWDKVRFEEQQFWVTRFPGLNALPASQRPVAIEELRQERPDHAEQETIEREGRELLQKYVQRAYHYQGRGRHGHHDYAKLFSERTLQVLAADGWIGLVLPRQSLVLAGWTDLRLRTQLDSVVSVLQARNRGGWFFDDVHQQFMVALFSRGRAAEAAAGVRIWPGVSSVNELIDAENSDPYSMTAADVAELTDTAVIPWFDSRQDTRVFEAMKARPRLGAGEGWVTGTADSARWDFSASGRHRELASTIEDGPSWAVLMARHVVPFGLDRARRFQRFIGNPHLLSDLDLGIVENDGVTTVGPEHPVIIYRYPSMRDNTRTLIASALPRSGYVYSKGYVHGIRTAPDTGHIQILALLAYLNSFTCDWWVRRFADRHITQSIVENLRLPSWDQSEMVRAAAAAENLLCRNGIRDLPGGWHLEADNNLSALPQHDVLSEIEILTLSGFDLDAVAVSTISQDFQDCELLVNLSAI